MAADEKYSPKGLDEMDRLGLFTPAFKAAVHDMVDTKKALAATQKEEKEINDQLPDLKKQAADAEAKVAALQTELTNYDHTDESDFTGLRKKMSDAGTTVQEQIVLAQAYVWAYPTSPHLAEAQQDLQQVQKKQADQTQAEKDAEAARAAARAKLIQRAQARDLSLAEWRDFLNDMSQEDLLKYLGRPQSKSEDYWVYTDKWTEDPATHQKSGLMINFNAGRVISVTLAPHS